MHWAGRIEKELDKVLQHVTGTQQMRSVSPRQRCVRRTMFTCIINQPGFTGQVTQLCVCVCVLVLATYKFCILFATSGHISEVIPHNFKGLLEA